MYTGCVLEIFKNWDRWSEMVAVKLPDITSGWITFEYMLFILWELESIVMNIMSIGMASYSGWL